MSPEPPTQTGERPASDLRRWVEAFIPEPILAERVFEVVVSLPAEVRRDLTGDPDFVMDLYDPEIPGPVVIRLGRLGVGSAGARSVSLRRSLARRSPDFAAYVIAHEFAHAFLRNVCRPSGEEVEAEADALAAEWGFPRPAPGKPMA